MLSCTCSNIYEWYYTHPSLETFDFQPLDTKRRVRCCSCKNLIDIGSDCLTFWCHRDPTCEYEENRFGDEVPLANRYLCFECGQIWMNLTDIGYCIELGHDLHEDLEEYWEMTGFKPANQEIQAD